MLFISSSPGKRHHTSPAVGLPPIIDPAQQALEWLKKHLGSKRVTVDTTSGADERFQTTLELAVRFGKTLIISEVDRVEPILYPLLRGDLMTAGPKRTVQIGEKQVDWQDSFRPHPSLAQGWQVNAVRLPFFFGPDFLQKVHYSGLQTPKDHAED